jgi:phage-related tail protein
LPEEKKINVDIVQRYLTYGLADNDEQRKAWHKLTMSELRMSGYAGGTSSAMPGLRWVGENGPELMAFRGGERVYNAGDSRRIASEARRDAAGAVINLGGINVNVNGGNSAESVVEAIRGQMPVIANELCEAIAPQLTRAYSNMPSVVEGL